MDRLKAYFLGRATRSEYWIWVVCLTIGTVIANVALRNATLASGLSFIPWAIIASRRLRDFGWSPWWCLSTLALGFLIGFVSGFINALLATSPGEQVLSKSALTVAYAVANWGVIIFIGSRPSVTRTDKRADGDEALARVFE